jgi:hypothetical protein
MTELVQIFQAMIQPVIPFDLTELVLKVSLASILAWLGGRVSAEVRLMLKPRDSNLDASRVDAA